jgi:hypothetical protein
VENTAQLSGEQPGKNSPEKIPSTGKDCNPQPANCLKVQYVLRHCCVYDRTGKTGHSAYLLVSTRFNTENRNIIPCEPSYSKLTFTILSPGYSQFFHLCTEIGLITSESEESNASIQVRM